MAAACGFALVAVAAGPAPAGTVVSETTSTPFDGVTIVERIEESPNNRIYVAFVALCTDFVHMAATAPPTGRATPGAWASAQGLQLASNGDFYTSGSPPLVYGDAVGAGIPWPFDQTGNSQGSAWYYHHYGWIAFGPDWVEFNHTEQTKTADADTFGITLGWRPTEVTEDKPAGTIALVSGFPELVIEGQTYTCSSPTASDCFPDRTDMRDRHPRTAMGLTEDRQTFILAVVDGRDEPSSYGMYGAELAALMADLGAWEAFNLDGGGSSALWLEGQSYLNQPTDGSARSVANHWGAFAGAASGQPQSPSNCFVPGGCFPTPLVGGEGEPFRDMPAGSYAHDEAIALLDHDITNGCRPDPPLFCPSCTITRSQIATFLVRAEGIEPDPPGTPTFDDVPPSDSLYPYVEAAHAAGIITGCSQTSFCPGDDVSRADLAAYCQRARQWPLETPDSATFNDVASDHPSYQEIEAIAARCIDDGCGDGAYCPDAPASRGLAARFITRAYQLNGPVPCDPGSGGGGSGGSGGTTTSGTGGAPNSPGLTGSDGGCGCRATPAAHQRLAGLAGIALTVLLIARLRRRGRAARR